MSLKNVNISETNALMLDEDQVYDNLNLFLKKNRKGPTAQIPDKSVRLDNVNHWPEFADKKV